jgi:hypothetical protein
MLNVRRQSHGVEEARKAEKTKKSEKSDENKLGDG